MRQGRIGQAVGAALLSLLFSPFVRACPFCAGPEGEGNPVREAIFGASFAANLLVTAAPFAVFLLAAALVHFGLPLSANTKTAPLPSSAASGQGGGEE